MAPKKRVLAVVKIQLPAGGATPAPPVGTALGPHGVQTMEFCKQYNAATENQRGTIIPVEITIYEDRTFTFVLKTPPTPALLRQAAGLEKGASDRRSGTGRHGHRHPDRRDRSHQAARPEHRRRGGSQEAGRRHGPVHGHRRQPAEPGPQTIQETENPTVSRGKKYKASTRPVRPRAALLGRPRRSIW